MDSIRLYLEDLAVDLSLADSTLFLLLFILVSIFIVLDAILLAARKQNKKVGIDKPQNTISLDGADILPSKNYLSSKQGLAGRPDALVRENGFFIPVERKPLSKKIRDRHVAQLLVYMRLVEEFEGKKPPYGYLILGKNSRRVKILNTEKKQKWLQQMIDEMRAIVSGEREARPVPHPKKCAKCPVREQCSIQGVHSHSNLPKSLKTLPIQ